MPTEEQQLRKTYGRVWKEEKWRWSGVIMLNFKIIIKIKVFNPVFLENILEMHLIQHCEHSEEQGKILQN